MCEAGVDQYYQPGVSDGAVPEPAGFDDEER
jgi:hypothetical protein